MNRSGARCFLTTDQERYRGEHLRNTFGGGKLFEQVFFSAEIGYTKKDPAFFESVYRTINQYASEQIARDEILVVDDGENNIETAKHSGFVTHLYMSIVGLKRAYS